MILTHEILHSAGTAGVGFNWHQLKLLGVSWPPKKGWLSKLVGQEIPDETWLAVLEMKGAPKAERRRVLRDGARFTPDAMSVPDRLRGWQSFYRGFRRAVKGRPKAEMFAENVDYAQGFHAGIEADCKIRAEGAKYYGITVKDIEAWENRKDMLRFGH